MPNEEEFRNWPARYRNWTIELFETVDHYHWVATSEIRKILPTMLADKFLEKTYGSELQKLDKGPRLFISEKALILELKRINTQESHKLLAWLDKQIIYPASRKRGELKSVLPVHSPTADAEEAALLARIEAANQKRPSYVRAKAKPREFKTAEDKQNLFQILLRPVARHWRGWYSLSDAVFKAGCMLLLWIYLLHKAHEAATNMDTYTGAYVMRQWAVMGLIALLAGALVWWAVGMMRSALRAQRAGGSFAVSLVVFVGALSFLLLTAEFTVATSGEWVAGWWQMITNKMTPTTVVADLQRRRIVVSGDIGFGSYTELNNVLKKSPELTLVEIESPGGYVVEGLAMARMIQGKRLDTVSLDHCMSACTMLLAAGAERYLGPNAKVGFHRSWSYKTLYSNTVSPTDVKIANYYRSRNTAENLVRQFLQTPGYEMWYPRHDVMYTAGYATHRWEERKPAYRTE
jgi:hypothetical protein